MYFEPRCEGTSAAVKVLTKVRCIMYFSTSTATWFIGIFTHGQCPGNFT